MVCVFFCKFLLFISISLLSTSSWRTRIHNRRYRLFLRLHFLQKFNRTKRLIHGWTTVKIVIMKQMCGKQARRQRSASSELRVDDLQTQMNGTNLFPSTALWIDSLMIHNKSGRCKHRHLCWQQHFPCLQCSRYISIDEIAIDDNNDNDDDDDNSTPNSVVTATRNLKYSSAISTE